MMANARVLQVCNNKKSCIVFIITYNNSWCYRLALFGSEPTNFSWFYTFLWKKSSVIKRIAARETRERERDGGEEQERHRKKNKIKQVKTKEQRQRTSAGCWSQVKTKNKCLLLKTSQDTRKKRQERSQDSSSRSISYCFIHLGSFKSLCSIN